MGTIRESLKGLSTELISIFNENKEITLTSKRLVLIELKVSEIKGINEKSEKIDEEIIILANKLENKEQESKEISGKIEKVRNSEEYLENIEKEKSIETQEKQLEKEIYELKQLIDFKALTNFFHIFEDRMEIVKLYRDDFIEEFKKDKGSRLLNLLNESKLNTERIYDKIKQIHDMEVGIENNKKEIKEDETKYFSSEFEKTNAEIKDLQNEIGWAEKKKEKLKTTDEETIKIIKEELKLIGLNLKD
jgi:DNA repair exonuclease SbcCD ATPase subunit